MELSPPCSVAGVTANRCWRNSSPWLWPTAALGWAYLSPKAQRWACSREDDADELIRRAADTFAAYDLRDPIAAAGRLHLDARAGKSNTLMTFNQHHVGATTALFTQLRQRCQALQPVLVVVDNLAQVFAGVENARAEVTQFCNSLTGLAREFDCAVLLLGHTAKAEGSEFSGSTAWDAAVRSRLLLERRDDGSTHLQKLKANYSQLDEIRMRYDAGRFEVIEGDGVSPEMVDAAKPVILAAVQTLRGRQQAASHLDTARNYLLKLMRNQKLDSGCTADVLRAALAQMLDDHSLVPNATMPWKSESRHVVRGLEAAQ